MIAGPAQEIDLSRRTAEVEREHKAAVDHPAFRRWWFREDLVATQ